MEPLDFSIDSTSLMSGTNGDTIPFAEVDLPLTAQHDRTAEDQAAMAGWPPATNAPDMSPTPVPQGNDSLGSPQGSSRSMQGPRVREKAHDKSATWPFLELHQLLGTSAIGEATTFPPTPPRSTVEDLAGPLPTPTKKRRAQSTGTPELSVPNSDLWVRKVADMNIRLFEHAATLQDACCSSDLARVGTIDCSRSAVIGMGLSSVKEEFAIDTTFQLSKELVGILGDIFMTENQDRQQSGSQNNDGHFTRQNQAIPVHRNHHDSLRVEEGQTQYDPAAVMMDPGSSLLILSCYTRILDIFSKFFYLMATSLSTLHQEDSHVKGVARAFVLPKLVVGNFSLNASPALQVTLIIGIIEEELERLRSQVARLDPGVNSTSSRWGQVEDDVGLGISDLQGVGEATLQAIRVREGKITRHMNELRRELQTRVSK